MLTISEKNAIKKIMRAPAPRRAELQALLDNFEHPETEIDIRQTLLDFSKIKTHINSPKRIGLTKAGVVEFDPSATCHQSNKVVGDIKTDLAILLEWEITESIEAF